MKIRKYNSSDRADIEKIYFETGFIGKSMSEILSRKQEFNIGVEYYLNNEQESILVLEANKEVVGYLLGCLDDSKHLTMLEIALTIFLTFIKMPFLPKKDKKFWKWQLVLFLKAIFRKLPDAKLKHPKNAGHIHINILPGYRNKGYGTRMLNEFVKYARSKNVKIIHADSWLHGNKS